MAQRALWLEEQKLIPAQRREGNAKLLAIAVLHLVAVSLFTSGFLLSRKQVDLKSHELSSARLSCDRLRHHHQSARNALPTVGLADPKGTHPQTTWVPITGRQLEACNHAERLPCG